MPTTSTSPALLPRIESRIVVVRGLRVMIDADLATLYGVTTKRLNEQVKRNAARFPADFMFQLNAAEKAEVVANCDHLAKLKFSKTMPYAFTEYGAIQASNVLATAPAVEMGIYVVRAFVRMRELAAVHTDLAKRLDELERKTEALALDHDRFSRSTRQQLQQVFDTLRELMTPPDPPKRPIGFIRPDEKGKKAQASARRTKA
jgi:ORF6N domain